MTKILWINFMVATMIKKNIIYCCNCQKDKDCYLIDGKKAYPHRNDIFGCFWQCEQCLNFVGTHNNKKNTPLGCIPTKEIKNARQHIHRILDPLWQKGKIRRGHLYSRLSEFLGREYHTAQLRTIDECRNIYLEIKKISNEISQNHIYQKIENPENYLGQKVHVENWNFKSVFKLLKIENGFFILQTPKTQKIFKTKNNLTHLSG